MAQYEKLINLSLLNQFLTKAKTIFAQKITASGILKGDGQGGVSAAEAGTDYATPALVKVSDTQPTEPENKLWVDTDAGSGNSYQIPTVAEMQAAVAEIKPIMPTQPIAIPASGTTVAYDISGLTGDHRLVQWNFADNGTALAENSPPCSLEWTTYDGYFTITNNGGTTTATMQPLFLIPAFLPATTHTS